MYHRSEPAKIVHSQEELEELGDDWVESPAMLGKQDNPKPAADPDDDDDLDDDLDDVEELAAAPAAAGNKRNPTKKRK
jgi:hypothetical protein